jgi:microcystin-dependent protein
MTDADLVVIQPLLTILAWSGLLIDIPDGWQLCDGTNSTPDFTDKFLIGAPAATNPGGEGGENLHTLTIAEMPSHNHSTFSNGGGNHNHSGISNAAVRQRTGIENDRVGASAGGQQSGLMDSSSGGFSIGSTGGSPHENKPPFYEVAFIMRLS